MEFLKLFGRLKSVVIGMVHVGALPGTPQSSLPLTQITDKACYESEIYKDAGVLLQASVWIWQGMAVSVLVEPVLQLGEKSFSSTTLTSQTFVLSLRSMGNK
nr:protein C19orf12 homolog isoform X8 [Pelodiscus sinensis]|eukprot:XP_025039481.1 protein C19orf12 homolog isoform X8 [Pelodiscus sinensis]